ncbi:MAG TPA: DNA-directed RNA polymerase subunit omega, partial [bacterium]
EQILSRHENLYASVVIMAKRARQVTDQQKIAIDMEKVVPPVTEAKESEDYDEVEIDREALLREHKKFPKPTSVAIEEMHDNKIQYEFVLPEPEK